MPEIHSFGIDPITCHSWNKERNQVALSLNNDEVQLQSLSGGKWTLKETLTDHTQRVTGIDWAEKSNRIVTCAADRNAYVWVSEGGKWKPTLVVLGLNRAATCVKWSPKENKFAVGSGNRSVAVCSYDSDNNWWSSKKIKKPIRSTVTCLDWHPNNYLVACGSTDFKARVFSAYIKEVDEKPGPCNWGSKLPFANLMGEYSSEGGGWVHGISFSASGDRLAWVGHDTSICVVDASQGLKLTVVKTEHLPFMDITWITESSFVVAGYGCVPMRFNYNNGITFASKLDDDNDSKQAGKKVTAMDRFKAMDSRAATDVETALNSVHQNTISQLSIFAGGKEKCTKLTSVGTDGQLVIWDIK
jgi:actin related protein 2/3 complex, subunit 1A/1B